ncbi:hypothetical protein [Altererythrobacter sp. TH136]|uniref:hypothetical protein n=1 Tax=Altererythrobacter sp. TH136 TaxID=2067415 RepID=UPI0011639834|nr:hypothetical protein [Altererythrobacter sp. TH136]QDM41446.1 hypothetical protein C0V74_10640 [Altererythrobacter sp. TH136]
MSWGWLLLLGGVVLVVVGYSLRRPAMPPVANDFDLGLLGPIAASVYLNELTSRQLQHELSQLAFVSRTAQQLWGSMSLAEREELGRNQITLWADPDYQVRTKEALQEMREIDPELFDQAGRSVSAQETMRQTEKRGEIDELVREALALKEVDPEGFEQIMAALHAKAAEADT